MTPDGHRGDLFLGVDGGGTHAHAVVIDRRGACLAAARAPSTNPFSVGATQARSHLGDLVGACVSRLPAGARLRASVFALAGVSTRRQATRTRAELRETFRGTALGNVAVTNDTLAALWGAAPRLPALALVAGTGSHCLGIDAGGRVLRCLGLEHLLSDDGSAYDVGHRVLRFVVRSCDGRDPRPSALPRLALARLRAADLATFFERLNRGPNRKQRVARFARVASVAALQGDAVAQDILRDAAASLVEAVSRVATGLGVHRHPFDLVGIGGLLRQGEIFRRCFEDQLRRSLPATTLRLAGGHAAAGAARLARDRPPFDIWACYEQPCPVAVPAPNPIAPPLPRAPE